MFFRNGQQNRKTDVFRCKNRKTELKMTKTEKPKIPTPRLQTRNTLAGLIFIYKIAMRIFVQAFAHLSTLALSLNIWGTAYEP